MSQAARYAHLSPKHRRSVVAGIAVTITESEDRRMSQESPHSTCASPPRARKEQSGMTDTKQCNLLDLLHLGLVPGGGVEPPWPQGPADFESKSRNVAAGCRLTHRFAQPTHNEEPVRQFYIAGCRDRWQFRRIGTCTKTCTEFRRSEAKSIADRLQTSHPERVRICFGSRGVDLW